MRITKRTAIIIGIIYLLALVATIPANLFSGLINRNLAGVTVSGLRGSIWNGHIDRLTVRQASLEGVEWHFQPWAILLGRLQLGLEYADTQNRLELSVAQGFTGTQHIRGLDGQLRVAYVQSLTPYAIPEFKGGLLFEDVDLQFEDGMPSSASGRIQWQGAAIDIGQTVNLGQLEAQLSSRDKGGIAGRLTETSGRLEGEATAELDAQGRWTLNARFIPTEKGADLTRHLALVMKRTGDGSFRLNRSGKVRLQ
ncbi:MAG: type II secretion system protein N [Gammaproteobacteria bacterium]|nr:type II secretion system protein N [Gammaproteobacteria bacterium]